jgi:hypothetical protein
MPTRSPSVCIAPNRLSERFTSHCVGECGVDGDLGLDGERSTGWIGRFAPPPSSAGQEAVAAGAAVSAAPEGKTPREARRALKRHLANVIYRRLYAWAEATPALNT